MTAVTDTDAREAFAERLIEDTTRALEIVSVHLCLSRPPPGTSTAATPDPIWSPRTVPAAGFQFGWSLTHCLPATMAENPVEANGTMLRSLTLARWAREAGRTTRR